jgi:proprotein convertase subtilisin/kexin type 5
MLVLVFLSQAQGQCQYDVFGGLLNTLYQSTSGSCPVCNLGCKSCGATATSCSNCLDSYYLSNSLFCVPCPAVYCRVCAGGTCQGCVEGYYLSVSVCLPCPAGSVCITSTFVQSCLARYYFSGQSCLPCANNCLACSSSACSSCDVTYYPSGQACVPCLLKC